MKKIASFCNDVTGNMARIYKHEDEFIVRLYVDGLHYEPADYFTGDRGDAWGTAVRMLSDPPVSVKPEADDGEEFRLRTEQIDMMLWFARLVIGSLRGVPIDDLLAATMGVTRILGTSNWYTEINPADPNIVDIICDERRIYQVNTVNLTVEEF